MIYAHLDIRSKLKALALCFNGNYFLISHPNSGITLFSIISEFIGKNISTSLAEKLVQLERLKFEELMWKLKFRVEAFYFLHKKTCVQL